LAALVVCLAAGPASADMVELKLVAASGQDFKYLLNNNAGEVSNAGSLTFQYVKTLSGTPILSGTFQTFCVDLTQFVQFNQNTDFQVDRFSNLPDAGAGLNATQAEYLSELWSKYHDLTGTSANDMTAFQIAVWEVVYGSLTNGKYSLWSGTFQANYTQGTEPAYVDIAQTWVQSLTGTYAASPLLIDLSSPTAQDQITAVPAPPGLLLAGIGGLGLLFSTRRRRLI
jgi:hypothetical protein